MMRKKNTDISKSNNDLNDVEYLKTRITLLDNVVQKITKEKNTLNQELERTKYELLKKNQELETKLVSKETDLRRVMNKLKPLELEYKNLNAALLDEKKRLKECQKNLEAVSTYLYQSYGYVNPFGYPIGQTLPTQRVVEKMRKSKQKFAPESTRRFEDVSNSTDESIHLVRSRKIGGKLKIIYV